MLIRTMFCRSTPSKLLTRFAVTILLIAALFTRAQTRTATAPQTKPSSTAPDPAREQKVKKLLDYLEDEYAKKTAAPYWVTRAMGTVSLARISSP